MIFSTLKQQVKTKNLFKLNLVIIAANIFCLLFFHYFFREVAIKIAEHILHRDLYHAVWHEVLRTFAFYGTVVFCLVFICSLSYFGGKTRFAKFCVLILCVFMGLYSFIDNYRSQYFGDGQKRFNNIFPIFMHSPYQDNIEYKLTIRPTILFNMAKKGHIEFFVDKSEEAREYNADGISLVIFANDKEIVRMMENPYQYPGDRHTVKLDFAIPSRTKNLTLLIEENENAIRDHVYIEIMKLRTPSPAGWFLLISASCILLYIALKKEIGSYLRVILRKHITLSKPEISTGLEILSNKYLVCILYTIIIFAVYSPAIINIYAFYDDWSFTRWNFNVLLSQGRPFFAIIIKLFSWAKTVEQISYMRLFSIANIVFCTCILYFILKQRNIIKNNISLFFVPLFLAFVPGMQIYVNFGILFQYPVGIVFSYFSYLNVIKRKIFLSMLCIVLAFGMNQIGGMCFLIPLFLDFCFNDDSLEQNIRKMLPAIGVLFFGMAISFVMSVGFPIILHLPRGRSALVVDFLGKINWFFKEPFLRGIDNFSVFPNVYYRILSTIIIIYAVIIITSRKVHSGGGGGGG